VESPRTKDSSPTKQESNHTYFTDNQLKSKFSQNHQNDGAQKSPVSRMSLERQKSGTKFEEIQASFAKELA
jgi:transcription initiation factor IIE alpha subunit